LIGWGRHRLDDALVAGALAAVAVLCMAFAYLPMTDLPQHYALSSIVANHGDPAYGFAERYGFDFLGRPYAVLYLLAGGLAKILPLGAVMRFVVALCTIAPLAGLWALLAAAGRPRIYTLLALPFAFGRIWHWGFLAFLLGTGMLLALLALTILQARAPTRRRGLALGAAALLLLFTHLHGLLMLLGLAPALAWAFTAEPRRLRATLRTCLPLVPAAIVAGLLVLTTWSDAEGTWAQMSPGFGERLRRFPVDLGAGIRDPWPLASLLGFAAVLVLACALARGREPWPARRPLLALGFALATQVLFYFALPLSTPTVAFVSARHALLGMLLALPLLPVLAGRRHQILRGVAAAVAVATIAIAAVHLRAFDREARDFDAVLARMEPNRRVATLLFLPRSERVHPEVMPYLHFDGYYQARRGGDLGHSFALAWNVPVRYRADYDRYPLDERIEFAPHLFSLERDLPHFDYLLIRAPTPPRFPPQVPLAPVVRSGRWSLWAYRGPAVVR
jgi:hypothetical protein